MKKDKWTTLVLMMKQKKYTPEECVQSRNMLSSAIRSIYRDFCCIPPCKVNCFRSWKISMVHHFLLYCEITSTFQDRMLFSWWNFTKLWSKLPLKYFQKNFSWWRERGLERTVKFAEKTTNECDWILLKVINDICNLKSFLFHIFYLVFNMWAAWCVGD